MQYSSLKASIIDHEKRIARVETAIENISAIQKSLSNIEGYLKGKAER